MSELKKIEWLEDVKLGHDTKLKGTTDFVNAADYDTYVMRAGWAKDAETGVTREGGRNLTPQVVAIDNSTQAV